MRPEIESVKCAGLVPDAIVIAGDDSKCVPSRRNIAVVGRAPAACIDPVFVVTFQFVLELHLLRSKKTKPRVVEGQVSPSGRDFSYSVRIKTTLIDVDIVDMHRRSQGIGR